MEGLEVDLFAGDEKIAIDMIQWQDPSGQDVRLLHYWLLGNAFNEAHVEGLLVEFLSDHLVDFLLHV